MVSVACEQLVAKPVTVTGLPGQAAIGAIEQSGVTHGGWRHSTNASQSIAASGEQSPWAVACAVNLTWLPGVQSDGMVNVAVSWQGAPGASAVQVFDVPPAVIVTSSLAGEVFLTVNVIVTGLPPHANGGATGASHAIVGLVRHRTVQVWSLESDPQSLVLLALTVNGTLSPKLHCGIGTGANVKLTFSFGAAVIGPLL